MIYDIQVPIVDPFITIEAALDGTAYSLDLSWNTRAALWFLDLYLPRATGDREPILQGQAMVAQRPLLAGCVHPERPAGELIIVSDVDPRRYDWGTVAKLRYYDLAQLEQILD